MAFGSDGKLYITSGDRNYGELVQDRSTHFGKIIRLNDDGSVPQDNPFVGQEGWQPEIWSTGHRNPTGLSLDPATGTLWETEFGPRGGDELNRIERGANYGWMDVTQGKHYDGTPAKGVTGVAGMTDPVLAWLPDSHNPGNVAVYHGVAFPQWDGDLLVAMMDRSLIRAELGADGQVSKQEVLLKDLGQRFRDVRVGPDGEIYLLTDENEGALLKITAKP
jgi:glucose/arabinose dehydrogenase